MPLLDESGEQEVRKRAQVFEGATDRSDIPNESRGRRVRIA
jgi:hypothetical protein